MLISGVRLVYEVYVPRCNWDTFDSLVSILPPASRTHSFITDFTLSLSRHASCIISDAFGDILDECHVLLSESFRFILGRSPAPGFAGRQLSASRHESGMQRCTTGRKRHFGQVLFPLARDLGSSYVGLPADFMHDFREQT